MVSRSPVGLRLRIRSLTRSSIAFVSAETVSSTRYLVAESGSTLERGATAWVDAPYGAFSIDRLPPEGYVFLAGGIGIAPIMSMLRTLVARGDRRSHILFYAYRTWERLTFREELEAMAETLDLRLVFVLEEPPEGWTGETGRIRSNLLARHLPEPIPSDRIYLVCGPQPMIQASERALRALGVPLGRIHSELFNLV